jgi:hypothetical protein
MLGMHANFVPLGECCAFHNLPSHHLNISGPSGDWATVGGEWGHALDEHEDLDALAEEVWESMVASCGQGE